MDIHHLRVFLGVYRTKSFTKASQLLNLSQPTISSHIKALEDELGIRLFDRIGRNVLPTKDAEALSTLASEIVHSVDEIKDSIGALRSQIKGDISIGASTIPATYLIPRAVAEFRKKNPSVFIRVISGDSASITKMVASDELLIGAVGAKMMHSDGLQYTPFYEDEIVFVVSPKLNIGRINKKTISSVPFVLREEGSGTRKVLEEHLKREGIESLNVISIFGSTEAVKEAVRSGLGVSAISKLSVREELSTGSLRRLSIRGISPIKRSFYLITKRGRTLPIRYLTLKNFLIDFLY